MTLAHAGSIPARLLDRFKGLVSRDEDAPIALDATQAWELYDAQAQKHLGMSASEFERQWNRGVFRQRLEDPAVRRVIMLRTPNPKR